MRSTRAGGVAIIGMACSFPGCADLSAYFESVIAGGDFTPTGERDLSDQRPAHETALAALADASLPSDTLERPRVKVVVARGHDSRAFDATDQFIDQGFDASEPGNVALGTASSALPCALPSRRGLDRAPGRYRRCWRRLPLQPKSILSWSRPGTVRSRAPVSAGTSRRNLRSCVQSEAWAL